MPEPILISDMAFGQLSERYAARVGEARARGLQTISGFRMKADGGVARRPGTIFVQDGLGITPATYGLYDSAGLPSFILYRYNGSRWLAYIDGTVFKAFEQGTGSGTASITNASLEEGIRLEGTRFLNPENDLDYLHIWTPNVACDIELSTASLVISSIVDDSAIFDSRHLGIKRTTGVIQMSEVRDYLDWTNDETESIPLTLVAEFAGVETPQWLRARRGVYVGTDEGIWEIYSSLPFFSEELGGMGARKVHPTGADGAEYYGSGAMVLRDLNDLTLVFPNGENFETNSLSERIDNKLWVQHATVDHGTHRYIHALDVEGNLYTYLEAATQGITGWVTMMTSVGWCITFGKDLYIGVERSGAYSVEVIPLDELEHPGTRTYRQHAMFHDYNNDVFGDRSGYHVLDSGSLVGDELPPSTLMNVYSLSSSGGVSALIGQTMTDANGDFVQSLAGMKTFTGYTSGEQYLFSFQDSYEATGSLLSLPVNRLIGGRDAIYRVVLQVVDTSGAKVRVMTREDGTDYFGGWEQKTVTSPESGQWFFSPEHKHGDELRIHIETVAHKPLIIQQILVELEEGDIR